MLLLLASFAAAKRKPARPKNFEELEQNIDALRAADGMPPIKRTPKPDEGPDGLADYPPLKKDIPYIQCSVCQKMAAKAYASVKELVDAGKSTQPKKVRANSRFEHAMGTGELQGKVDEVMDRLCDIESEEGKWMAEYDIVKNGPELKLIHYKPGTCRRECRTMQRACEIVVESIDFELASALQKLAEDNASVGMAQQRVCNKLSKVCKKGNTPPHIGKRKNEEFWPFTEADVKMEMAKRFLSGNMPGLQQVNNPRREKPSDDIDELHDEL